MDRLAPGVSCYRWRSCRGCSGTCSLKARTGCRRWASRPPSVPSPFWRTRTRSRPILPGCARSREWSAPDRPSAARRRFSPISAATPTHWPAMVRVHPPVPGPRPPPPGFHRIRHDGLLRRLLLDRPLASQIYREGVSAATGSRRSGVRWTPGESRSGGLAKMGAPIPMDQIRTEHGHEAVVRCASSRPSPMATTRSPARRNSSLPYDPPSCPALRPRGPGATRAADPSEPAPRRAHDEGHPSRSATSNRKGSKDLRHSPAWNPRFGRPPMKIRDTIPIAANTARAFLLVRSLAAE